MLGECQALGDINNVIQTIPDNPDALDFLEAIEAIKYVLVRSGYYDDTEEEDDTMEEYDEDDDPNGECPRCGRVHGHWNGEGACDDGADDYEGVILSNFCDMEGSE